MGCFSMHRKRRTLEKQSLGIKKGGTGSTRMPPCKEDEAERVKEEAEALLNK